MTCAEIANKMDFVGQPKPKELDFFFFFFFFKMVKKCVCGQVPRRKMINKDLVEDSLLSQQRKKEISDQKLKKKSKNLCDHSDLSVLRAEAFSESLSPLPSPKVSLSLSLSAHPPVQLPPLPVPCF